MRVYLKTVLVVHSGDPFVIITKFVLVCLVTLGVSYVQLACSHRWYGCLTVECQ